MNKTISFIHCADLHIDSPFVGLSHLPPRLFDEVKESTYQALKNLVDYAIEKQVDFVLMVGDLFDQEQQSLKAQSRLRDAFVQLKAYNIDVFVSYGNHDHINGRIFDFDYPDNVYVFDQDNVIPITYKKNDDALATIYGFSYLERAVDENKTAEYVKSGEAPFHIGMLHGSISSNTEHDVYAPFQLSDLTDKDLDYWALGHIHKRQILKEHPPIIYPGNTQGRSRKEDGEKGCYYVEMDRNHCTVHFQPLQAIRFETIEMDASNCVQIQDLEQLFEQQLSEVKKLCGKTIVTVELKGEAKQLQDWKQAGFIDELIDYYNESSEKESIWVFIQKIRLQHSVTWDREQLKQGNHFIGELVRSFDQQEDVSDSLQPLYNHRRARKYLQTLTIQEQQEIKTEAENLLLHHLLKDGEK
ncbi:metallophosphoesterase family protein [Aquibacillus sediminis]|uniref:metallophosphoesterase family protein n=1 Tax=Aquibacillus sediminis TaxID=2574734 RepID=UPI00110921AF|nr:DNA repair exonuclease [Aquibacillus sediminis]